MLPAVLRSIFAAFQNPLHPHHGRKRAVFVFAALLLLSSGDALAQEEGVAEDKAALEAFYDATNGSSWTINTNWKTGAQLSTWEGVTTDGVGRVTAVWLAYNNLSGTIPPELGNLPELRQLLLDGNELTGTG